MKDGAKSESMEGGADVSKSKESAKGGPKQESGKVSLLHSTVGGVRVITSVLITLFSHTQDRERQRRKLS